MAAFLLGLGSLGNIGAAYPMTMFVEILGWRQSILMIGGITVAVAMIAGSFFYRPLDRIFGTRKWVIFLGNLCGALLCFLLYLTGGSEFWSTMGIMAGIGFFRASFPVLVAHGRSFFPDHLMGRGVTLISLFGIGDVGLMQNISAKVFDGQVIKTTMPIDPYNSVILVFFGIMLIRLTIYLFSQDRTD